MYDWAKICSLLVPSSVRTAEVQQHTQSNHCQLLCNKLGMNATANPDAMAARHPCNCTACCHRYLENGFWTMGGQCQRLDW
jgi:hypothetical protein